jgi:hypothetical protein
MNSSRIAKSRAERIALENELNATAAKKLYDSKTGEREQAARELVEAKRELRKRLLTDVAESIADFSYTKYDGHMNTNTPEQIVAAIKSAWAEFTGNHPELSSQELAGVRMLLQKYNNDPDASKPEVYEQALSYINTRLAALDHMLDRDIVGTHESVSVPQADGFSEADPLAGLVGREREAKERELYRNEVLAETLNNGVYAKTLDEIATDTGRTIRGDDVKKFRHSLDGRKNFSMDRESIRFAFAQFFDAYEILSDSERAEIDRSRVIEACSSADIRRATGNRNTYNPTGGYVARRSLD